MAHWYLDPVNFIAGLSRAVINQMGGDLVAKEVEVYPAFCTASFSASKNRGVKLAATAEVTDRKGQMEARALRARHCCCVPARRRSCHSMKGWVRRLRPTLELAKYTLEAMRWAPLTCSVLPLSAGFGRRRILLRMMSA